MDYKYNCKQCRFHCNEQIRWKKHRETELHKTGKWKQSSDYKSSYDCEDYDYTTPNATTFKQHKLNEHSNKETSKKNLNIIINCAIMEHLQNS